MKSKFDEHVDNWWALHVGRKKHIGVLKIEIDTDDAMKKLEQLSARASAISDEVANAKGNFPMDELKVLFKYDKLKTLAAKHGFELSYSTRCGANRIHLHKEGISAGFKSINDAKQWLDGWCACIGCLPRKPLCRTCGSPLKNGKCMSPGSCNLYSKAAR